MRARREQFAQPIAGGFVGLGTILVRRHLVRLVHNHQVPVRFVQSRHHIGLFGVVHRGDNLVMLQPHAASPVRVHYIAVYHDKLFAELLFHLALPLVFQVSRYHQQHPLHHTPIFQLL